MPSAHRRAPTGWARRRHGGASFGGAPPPCAAGLSPNVRLFRGASRPDPPHQCITSSTYAGMLHAPRTRHNGDCHAGRCARLSQRKQAIASQFSFKHLRARSVPVNAAGGRSHVTAAKTSFLARGWRRLPTLRIRRRVGVRQNPAGQPNSASDGNCGHGRAVQHPYRCHHAYRSRRPFCLSTTLMNHPEFHASSGFCEPAGWSVTCPE